MDLFSIKLLIMLKYIPRVAHKLLICQLKVSFSHIYSKQQLKQIHNKYKNQPSLRVLEQYRNNGLTYYQMYRILIESPYKHENFQQFLKITAAETNQDDNFRIMRARLCAQIGKYYLQQNLFEKAKQITIQGVQIMQLNSLPPLIPYHEVYRQYGMILSKNGQISEAIEVLTECVEIIYQFIANSEDKVSKGFKDQALAYMELKIIDTKNSQKWHQRAVQQWQKIEEYNKINNEKYLELVCQQIRRIKSQEGIKQAKKYVANKCQQFSAQFLQKVKKQLE